MTPYEPDSRGIWLAQLERRRAERKRKHTKNLLWFLFVCVVLLSGAIWCVLRYGV